MSPKTLSIDVGGSGIKGMVLDVDGEPVSERVRFRTPSRAGPAEVSAIIQKLIAELPGYDRLSVGFPGVVMSGVVKTAPNLGKGWTDVPMARLVGKIAGKPCRVINDADMQGYGAIDGVGVEMMITLGTGMGAAVFTNGHLVPNLELGHHPFQKGKSYEQRIGNEERRRIGNDAWRDRVLAAIEQILPIWNPRVLHLGGGNAKKLKTELPDRVRPVANVAGILGGVRLWDDDEC